MSHVKIKAKQICPQEVSLVQFLCSGWEFFFFSVAWEYAEAVHGTLLIQM